MKSCVIKFSERYGALLGALALVVTTAVSNSACIFLLHQETMPEQAKKLRKF